MQHLTPLLASVYKADSSDGRCDSLKKMKIEKFHSGIPFVSYFDSIKDILEA
jgi:hypothetical protein